MAPAAQRLRPVVALALCLSVLVAACTSSAALPPDTKPVTASPATLPPTWPASTPAATLPAVTKSPATAAASMVPPATSPTLTAPAISSVQPSVTPQPQPATIQFAAWGGEAEVQAYQALITLYEQQHPGQTVNLVTVPDEADFQKRLAADFSAGTPADVMALSYLNMPSYASRGLLAPVAPFLSASRGLKPADFYRQAIGPFTYNRQLQCVPEDVGGLVVYYNRALFQQATLAAPRAGWTWDDILSDARALTRDTDGDGRPDIYGLGIEPSLIHLAPLVWQNLGALVNDPLWPSELALKSPAVVTATTWLVDLQTQYHVAPDSQAELASSSEQRFMDGTLAMYISTRAGVPSYRQLAALDWDVAPLPTLNGRGVNVLFADGFCLAAASAQKAAAWRYIEFADSAAGQAILAQSGAMIPAVMTVARSPDFLDPADRPASGQVFLDAVTHAEPLPLLENWSDIQSIADEELQQAFYGQKSVIDALTAATTRTDEYFKFHTAQ